VGEIWCALRYGVRCGHERMCLTVRGVSVPQRLHDRGKGEGERGGESE